METIGLRELNHNLSSILARVAAGARLVITDRGKPVADLLPHEADAARDLRERMIAEGTLRPARRKSHRLPSLHPGLADLPDSTTLLAAERGKDRDR